MSSSDARRAALLAAARTAAELGLVPRGYASSGLPGPTANRESFLWCATRGDAVDVEAAAREVEP